MENDEVFLKRAFELARLGRFTTSPNPNVGCVIVRDGRVIGEGYHQNPGGPHAEIRALHQAGNAALGATAYVTLEPCNHYGRTPPCTEALINAGIVRVVASTPDPNPKVAGTGFDRLKKAGIKVRQGLLSNIAEEINRGFLKRMRTGIPWIRFKLATSLDGRIAMSSGESKWITSLESRQDVQCWRAESDAILSTSSTILADNPSLTVRWSLLPKHIQLIYPKEQIRQPVRIIIDSANRVTHTHRVIVEEGQTWLARIFPDTQSWPVSVKQLQIPRCQLLSNIHIDLTAMLTQLGCMQVNNILVEAGSLLFDSLLSAGLLDELILYQAPKLLGAKSRPLCILPHLQQLDSVPRFTLLNIKQVGPDICLRLKPYKS